MHIARDSDGSLTAFETKPKRYYLNEKEFIWISPVRRPTMIIDMKASDHPEVTPDNSPVEIEFELFEKKLKS